MSAVVLPSHYGIVSPGCRVAAWHVIVTWAVFARQVATSQCNICSSVMSGLVVCYTTHWDVGPSLLPCYDIACWMWRLGCMQCGMYLVIVIWVMHNSVMTELA